MSISNEDPGCVGPTPEVADEFLYPIIAVMGLRTPKLQMDRDGFVDFGCFKVHVDDMESWTDEMIRAQGGQNALEWWRRWEGVLIPFFKQALREIEGYWYDPDNTGISRDLRNNIRPSADYNFPWPETPFPPEENP